MVDDGQHSCACVVAFGTRGDIVPLVAVLRNLIQRVSSSDGATKWLFVTHACFVDDLKACLPSCVEVQGVNTSPIAADASEENDFRSSVDLDKVFSSLESIHVARVISNLFALEAWAFALKRNIHYTVVHPNQPTVNTEACDLLLDSFNADYPDVCSALQTHIQPLTRLQWSDFQLWLWPTLTNLDSSMAANILLYDKELTVLILSSPMLVGEGQLWREHPRYHVCGAVVDGHLADSALLQPAAVYASAPIESALSHNDVCVVCSGTDAALMRIGAANSSTSSDASAVVCVDFGSMTHVILQCGQLQALLVLLCGMCETWRFIIVCHGHAATIVATIHQAHNAPARSLLTSHRFILVEHSVQHTVLFPRCVAVVHHGGIGTTNACVRAGVPQCKHFHY